MTPTTPCRTRGSRDAGAMRSNSRRRRLVCCDSVRLPKLRRVALSLVMLTGCGVGQKPPGSYASGDAAPDPNAVAPQDNPFVGAKLWVDPDSVAKGLARRWKNDRPEDAAAIEKIASQPTALWVGDWVADVDGWVGRQSKRMARGGYLPVFVAYNIPKRDCGLYSAGGAGGGQNYRNWIARFARAIGNRKAVVILEPDALPHMTECLSPEDQAERLALIKYAVASFASLGGTAVYLDAGHSDWVPAAEMAKRLKAAGIAQATGFSLNVSNYKRTEDLVRYGKTVSSLIGGKPFVIDTSRNGNGPPETTGDTEGSWCNPDGRALGAAPTVETGDPLVHAFLWVKKPGESDGTCNGGPKAGDFFVEKALELAKNAKENPKE